MNPAQNKIAHFAVADPRFPVGGRGLRRGGGVDCRGSFVSKFCMPKQKNLDPWGRTSGTPPRSANAKHEIVNKVMWQVMWP